MNVLFPDVQRGDLGRHLAALFTALETGLYERGEALRLCILAAIAGESLFLLGPPGVAKSLLARRLEHAFADAECFDYLMGRFSTPEEIFGPVSITRLKNDDLYVRRTEHYLPQADIVFLDEIWKASPPIQNALLTALNEKVFRNGNEEMRLPLKLLIAASNETAPDESSQAFWDRFLVRLELRSLANPDHFLAMLSDRSDPYRDVVPANLKIDRVTWLSWLERVNQVELSVATLAVIAIIRSSLQVLQAQGQAPAISDRRWKKCAGLLRAVAFCAERTSVEPVDCLVLVHCLWNKPDEQEIVRQTVETAVRDHAWGKQIQTTRLRGRLTELHQALRSASGYEEDAVVQEPTLADGEYYSLTAIPQAMTLPPDATSVAYQARIWKLDYESLPTATPAAGTDIFLFANGVYHSSAELPCLRAGQWAVAIQGETIPLVTNQTTVRQHIHRPLGEAEWAAWDQGISQLLADCQAQAALATDLIAQTHGQIASHFFVPPQAAEILTFGLQRYLSELANLQTEAQGCQDSHGSC